MPADAHGLPVTTTSVEALEAYDRRVRGLLSWDGHALDHFTAATQRDLQLGPRLIEIGGSRAQRDGFHETLIEACFRAGELDRAEWPLARRLLPRGDHFCRHRRGRAA